MASLKLRMALGVAAAMALSLSVITATLVHYAEHDTLRAQADREQDVAVRQAAVLSQRVSQLQRALWAASARLDPSMVADDSRLKGFVEGLPVLRALFETVFVASTDGKIRLWVGGQSNAALTSNLGDREYFRRTLAQRQPVVSRGIVSRVSGRPIVVLTFPLRRGDEVYGVLGGTLYLDSHDLLAGVTDHDSRVAPAEVVVTDATGLVLAHVDRARLLTSVGQEPRLAAAFERWRSMGAPVEPMGVQLAARGDVITAAGVQGADWVVWRAVPEAGLLAPLRAAHHRALLWGVPLVGLVGLCTMVLLWRTLRPLARLERRARTLFDAHEDPLAGWPDEGPDEIGRLARVLKHVGAERVRLEQLNSQVLRKLNSVMDAAPIGIAFTRKQKFELVSAEFCRLVGRPEHELLGQAVQSIYASAGDYRKADAEGRQAFKEARPYVGEWRMARPDGGLFWARLRGRPVDASNPQAGAIWTLNNIDDQVATRAQLEWSATHDPLTGLANRHAFEQRVQRVMAASPKSLPAALVLLDLDRFKPINDTAGHAAGDAVLKAVATLLAEQVRAGDLVVRLGGDEFALLLERCAPAVALRVADKVCQAVHEMRVPWEGAELQVGASLGVASLSPEMRDHDAWVRAADAACYRAKAEGRGIVRVAGAATQSSVDERAGCEL